MERIWINIFFSILSFSSISRITTVDETLCTQYYCTNKLLGKCMDADVVMNKKIEDLSDMVTKLAELIETKFLQLQQKNEGLNKTAEDQEKQIQGLKDRTDECKGIVLKYQNEILWLKAHLTSSNWTNAAPVFAVKLSSSTYISANTREIIFDDVIMNVNNAYNTSNGKVRASIAGRYFFSLTVRAYGGIGTGSAHASIMRNDQIAAYAVSLSSDIAYWAGTGSVSVVFDLDVGGIVYVGHPSGDEEVFQGRTTIFTGCLLYPL